MGGKNMRVNISYSVELDEVPERVLSFFGEVDGQLNELQETLESCVRRIAEKNYVVAVEEIGALRTLLSTIDFRMDDCMHILSAYSKALADLSVKDASSANPQQPSVAFTPEQVAWAEEEIRKLQEKKNESDSRSNESG
tara:strand:+ start:1300 stop:1716 length:417 start_codon:yes stop_codon:yes gene_type:complete